MLTCRPYTKSGRQAKQLWGYLVHQDKAREIFIRYIYSNKVRNKPTATGCCSNYL